MTQRISAEEFEDVKKNLPADRELVEQLFEMLGKAYTSGEHGSGPEGQGSADYLIEIGDEFIGWLWEWEAGK